MRVHIKSKKDGASGRRDKNYKGKKKNNDAAKAKQANDGIVV
jgi:hypothetical protein